MPGDAKPLMDYPTEEKPIADINIFICGICGNPTVPSYKDDVGTQFYRCEKGHVTNKPMKRSYTAESRNLNLPKENGANSGWGSRYATDDSEHFNPNSFANYLTGQFFFRTDKKTDVLYIYNSESGTWEPDGEIFIHQALVQRLALEVKPHYQEDVEYFIKGESYQNVEETPGLIALKNGVLDVVAQKLIEKSPGYFILNALPITYNDKAECPAIAKFLLDVFGDQQLTALQESLGYTLLKQPLFEKAFMLIGDGANGKSTFLNLLQAFLGRLNVSNVTLQEICTNRFASANLYGKMANVSADLPKTAIATSGRFKMLTGRDMISAEFKHKNAFQFVNTAKMWFSCNEFPHTTEDTLAYVRRWKIFNCNNVFLGDKADPKILEKLTAETELSGFLNWIIAGLKRLLDNGRFNVNETEENLRVNILKLSNPTKAFLENTVEESNDVNNFIIETELYSEFVIFCNTENLPAVKKSQFTQALKEYLPTAKQTKQRILGKEVHVYQYIKRKNSVPTVPSPLFDTEKNTIYSKISKVVGTLGTTSETIENKPSFYVKDIPAGEKCDCGNYAVTYEIVIPSHDVIRRCSECLKDLKAKFPEANWKQGYPELASYEEALL